MSAESLLNRIRGEFREMPGLRLTLTQACRFWQLDPPTCETALLRLVGEQFLAPTAGRDVRRARPWIGS